MPAVLDKVLMKLKPSPAEAKKFQNTIQKFLKKLNSSIQTLPAKALLGGSGEKDTWLSGSHDVDIFVLFDYQKYAEQSPFLADLLEKALQKTFPPLKRLHGSRDYFQINYQNYLFEIIPILKLQKAEQALNITDVSPLHAQWVKRFPKNLKDQIRLAKQFAKANHCYGAESYISGFSGYVLEILTIYYGSFENLLKASLQWENKDVIDVEKHYPKNDVFKQLNRSKLHSPLIVIDPVDKTRNAAAALNMEKFLLFKQKAQEFLQKPDSSFFEKQIISFKELETQTRHNLIYLEVTPLAGKEDVIGTKLLKIFHFLKKKLKKFEVKEAAWDWLPPAKAIFYFVLEKKQIAPYFLRPGPPLNLTQHVKNFKKRNKETFEEKGRLFAKLPLKHFQLVDYFKEILKDKYIKERIKNIKILRFG